MPQPRVRLVHSLGASAGRSGPVLCLRRLGVGACWRGGARWRCWSRRRWRSWSRCTTQRRRIVIAEQARRRARRDLRFFIDRPIFATVISVVITLAGGVAVFTLPVAQYPEVTPPTVQVTALYPGANALTRCATRWPRRSRSRSAASKA